VVFFDKLTDNGIPSWEEVWLNRHVSRYQPPLQHDCMTSSVSVEKSSLHQWVRTQGELAKFGSLLICLRTVLSDRVSITKMQNFPRNSSKKLYTEFFCVSILAMFNVYYCNDDERTWLLCWTRHMLCVLEKAKDRAMLVQLLEAFLIRWDSYVECTLM